MTFQILDRVNRFEHHSYTAMAASWTYPICSMHPWFRMPSNKRKTPELDSSDDSSDADSFLPKRRRCDALENGLAQLSLNSALHPPHQRRSCFPHRDPYVSPQYKAGFPPLQPPTSVGWNTHTDQVVDHTSPVIFPGSIEEPTSPAAVPEVPEVTMKSRSWYEPEKDRIVIVDLDDSDTDEPADEPAVQVNGALLDRLRSRREPDFQEGLTSPDSSKALVLFKPVLPLPLPECAGKVEESSEVTEPSLGTDDQNMQAENLENGILDEITLDDDDAMEVEQI